eukprot:CAMPEP_0183346436 /NCGR_PEP_ID=MMETSP0164_2-20130417/11561_1 /TAXON_ID=221442 /ORGANISM="Coccolithus pelagicus ssp braarudi, Strain PLY182g" /LENGTH=106 /DNA_ID=CAMNT_0025517715 /DNA_START=50 /DNA_END=366 /DNA_ORIENTATION=+
MSSRALSEDQRQDKLLAGRITGLRCLLVCFSEDVGECPGEVATEGYNDSFCCDGDIGELAGINKSGDSLAFPPGHLSERGRRRGGVVVMLRLATPLGRSISSRSST